MRSALTNYNRTVWARITAEKARITRNAQDKDHAITREIARISATPDSVFSSAETPSLPFYESASEDPVRLFSSKLKRCEAIATPEPNAAEASSRQPLREYKQDDNRDNDLLWEVDK